MPAQFDAPISLVGETGAVGARGFSLITGDGAPTSDLGSQGDTYLDLLSGDLYSPKGETTWGNAVRNIVGPQGIRGGVGPSGKALLNGYQPPADSVGQDGDSYFCQQNASVYGPKANGTWGASPIALMGPPGPGGDQGTIIYPTSDVPDNSMGRDGDFAIDTVHHTYYGPKASGSWGNAIDLVGPRGLQGEQGLVGDRGADGATFLSESGPPNATIGKTGDYWLDQDASIIYGPRTGDAQSPWPHQGFSFRGLQGPEGPVGPAGFMGQNGKSFIIASSDPSSSDGQDGDTWFNKTTGYIYGPKANNSWNLTTGDLIKGAPGDSGPQGVQGDRGPAGVGFLAGQGAPDAGLGETGQYYYDSVATVVYGPKNAGGNSGWGSGVSLIGRQGPVGLTGADSTVPGPQGPRGVGVYLRTSPPTNDYGSDGDGVILQGGDVYGPKSGGSWGSKVGSLVGPQGIQGPRGPAGDASTVAGPAGLSFLVGSGSPSSTYGNNGDSFFDQVGRAIYPNKTNGAWPSTPVSLVGQQGGQGVQGVAGRDGQNGTILRYGNGAPSSSTVSNDGDFYIDQTASHLFGPRTNGTWSSSYVALVGPTGQAGSDGQKGDTGSVGPAGQPGPAGQAGSAITYGTAEPGLTYGNVGDYYIKMVSAATWLLMYKVTYAAVATTPDYPNGWRTLGNLVGPQGVQGQQGVQGNQGSQGLQGNTGSQGPQGNVGPSGATIRNGTGAPTSSTNANDGDYYFATDTGVFYGPRANGSWPSTGTSLVGPQGSTGLSILTGTGAPSNSLGQNGQPYIDTTAWAAYVKSNGTWSSATSLIGPQGQAGVNGLSVLFGSGAPAANTGSNGQVYIDTTAYAAYTKSNGAWGPATSLVGPQGSQGVAGSNGLSVLTGSGAPASGLGVNGQVYIDTTAYAAYVKSNGTWSSATSLVGPQGSQGVAGPTGPAAASIVNGTGAPSSSNPGGTIQPGSFYIQTDTTPNRLYGPYTSANGWPSTYTNMGGGSFQTTNGPPAAALGSVGDCAIDVGNALFYPPKTSSGWTATPINMVGPTGPTGPTASYRNILRGYYWSGTGGPTAGTAYSVTLPIYSSTGPANFALPVNEPMYAAGSLNYVTSYAVSGVGAGVITLNILKNGTVVYTTDAPYLTIGSSASTARRTLPTNLTFAAGDQISMTVSSTTNATNQSHWHNLVYTTNS